MNERAPFTAADLYELDERLLSHANGVVALREVYAGNRDTGTIGMRHDVDNASLAFPTALKLARWEAERGYRSTYYLLHTARYWFADGFADGVREIAALEHEVGIHLDAVGASVAKYDGKLDPAEILWDALYDFRSIVPVKSCVGHGNPALYEVGVMNDCQIAEFAERRNLTAEYERVFGCPPRPLADFGLDFEAVLLGRDYQLTDSSGTWEGSDNFDARGERVPGSFAASVARFHARDGQMHLNMHPDWWSEAWTTA